jgi:hypothetical protein
VEREHLLKAIEPVRLLRHRRVNYLTAS